MDASSRPTLFDVQSYPILRDISGVTGSGPNGQAAFVDGNGAPQNIDHEAGGFLLHEHWLSRCPLEGQWGHWTYDYVQLVGVNGQLWSYPWWRFGNPGLGTMPTSQANPAEGNGRQDPSSHHNGGFPELDHMQSIVLFQHQQQPTVVACSQELRPVSHNPEPGFTGQSLEEPFVMTTQRDDLQQENLNVEPVRQERQPRLSRKRRRSRADSLPDRPVPEATQSSTPHEDSSHGAPENDGSVAGYPFAFRVIPGGETSAAYLRMTAEVASKRYARDAGSPTSSQLRDDSRSPEPGSTASDTSEASRSTTSTPSPHSENEDAADTSELSGSSETEEDVSIGGVPYPETRFWRPWTPE